MVKIQINNEIIVSKGGVLLKNGLVQGDKYRFWTHEIVGNKKMLNIQVCIHFFGHIQ